MSELQLFLSIASMMFIYGFLLRISKDSLPLGLKAAGPPFNACCIHCFDRVGARKRAAKSVLSGPSLIFPSCLIWLRNTAYLPGCLGTVRQSARQFKLGVVPGFHRLRFH